MRKYLIELFALLFVLVATVSGQALVFDQPSISFSDASDISPKTLKIKLSAQPDGSVLVRLTPPADPFIVSPCSLTFTRSNWNVEQSVTVRVKPYLSAAAASLTASISFSIDKQSLTSTTCVQSTQSFSLSYATLPSATLSAQLSSGNVLPYAITTFDGFAATLAHADGNSYYLVKSDTFSVQYKAEMCLLTACTTGFFVRYYDSTFEMAIDPVSGTVTATATNPTASLISDQDSSENFSSSFDGISVKILRVPNCDVGSIYCLAIQEIVLPGSFKNRLSGGYGGNFDGDATNDSLGTPPTVPTSDDISLCKACGHTAYNTVKCSAFATIPSGFCAAIFTTVPVPTPPIPGPIIIPDPPINNQPPGTVTPPFTVPDQPVIPPPATSVVIPSVPSSSPSAPLPSPNPVESDPVIDPPNPSATIQLGIPPVPLKNGSGLWNIKNVQKTLAKISKVGTDELQVTFPANCGAPANNKCGRESGMSFFAMPKGYIPSESSTMSYDVFFPKDFDFSKSGTLPGLSIGSSSGANGGSWTRNSGAARLIWQMGAGQRSPSLSPFFNFPTEVSKMTQTSAIELKPKLDDWNTISYTVKLNTPGRKDGSVTLTLNGVTKTQTNISFRKSKLTVNGLSMTSWYGTTKGDLATYGNPQSEAIRFRNFSVKKN